MTVSFMHKIFSHDKFWNLERVFSLNNSFFNEEEYKNLVPFLLELITGELCQIQVFLHSISKYPEATWGSSLVTLKFSIIKN